MLAGSTFDLPLGVPREDRSPRQEQIMTVRPPTHADTALDDVLTADRDAAWRRVDAAALRGVADRREAAREAARTVAASRPRKPKPPVPDGSLTLSPPEVQAMDRLIDRARKAGWL
jgi:hypothetical protein